MCRIDREEVIGLFTSVNLKDVWVFHFVDVSPPGDSSHTSTHTKEFYTPDECKRLIKIALGLPDKEVEIVSVLPWDSEMNVMDSFIHGRIFFAGNFKNTITFPFFPLLFPSLSLPPPPLPLPPPPSPSRSLSFN
jgi:putative polyketide hydroxylase